MPSLDVHTSPRTLHGEPLGTLANGLRAARTRNPELHLAAGYETPGRAALAPLSAIPRRAAGIRTRDLLTPSAIGARHDRGICRRLGCSGAHSPTCRPRAYGIPWQPADGRLVGSPTTAAKLSHRLRFLP